MKSLILYGSTTKLSNSHKKVTGPMQPDYFVRADLVDGDCLEALDKAKPRSGELVLNSATMGFAYTEAGK